MLAKDWLDTKQAAEWLGYSEGTLRNWRTKKGLCGPKFIRMNNGKVRYRPEDLSEYVQSMIVEPSPRMII